MKSVLFRMRRRLSITYYETFIATKIPSHNGSQSGEWSYQLVIDYGLSYEEPPLPAGRQGLPIADYLFLRTKIPAANLPASPFLAEKK